MTVYFTSRETNGTIRAISGFKAICIRDAEETAALDSRYPELPDESIDPKARLAVLRHVVTDSHDERDLIEEIDHFRCASNSRAAALLWVINRLVRWNHVAYAHRLASNRPHRSSSLATIRYHLHCLDFMWHAYPVVEAYFLQRSMDDPRRHRDDWDMQATHVLDAIGVIDQYPQLNSQQIGSILDRHYLARGRNLENIVRQVLAGQFATVIPRLFVRYANLMGLAVATPVIGSVSRDPRIKLSMLLRNLLERLQSPSAVATTQEIPVGKLPTMITATTFVDPAVLESGVSRHARIGAPNIPPADKFLADVWWYIVRTVCETVFYRAKRAADDQAFARQRETLRFFRNWKISDELAATNGHMFVNNLLHTASERIRGQLQTSAPALQPTRLFALARKCWDEWAYDLHELHLARQSDAHPKHQYARCVSLIVNGAYIQV